jgi:hypothetical protein
MVVAEEVRILVPHVRLVRIAAIAGDRYESKVAHDYFELVVEGITLVMMDS